MANIVNYISNATIPVIIVLIILYGKKDNVGVFDIF